MNEFDYLASLEFFGIKLGLDQTRELFRRLGSPEKNLRFLHVAGSNGKGSVCAYLEAAFRAAGFRTGLYISPHLIRVNERFCLNGVPVSDADLAAAIRRLRSVASDMEKLGKKITYFEATTALAALLFQNKTDVVLWETGMGGRLDATNIVTPLASVITGISLEHTKYLGDTLAKIAFEKAGIVKPRVPVFAARTTPGEALDVIRNRAAELDSPFLLSEPLSGDPPAFRLPGNGLSFLQSFKLADGTALSVPLPGPHQRRNAALAATVLKYLQPSMKFDLANALNAFASVRWDGRFQFIPGKHLIVDSGHNPEGIGVLADTLRELFPGRKFHFLFGAFSDKDTASSLAELAPLAASFTFLHMDTMRASRDGAELGAQLAHAAPGIPWHVSTLKDALAAPEPETILCGSLHLCGDALAELHAAGINS